MVLVVGGKTHNKVSVRSLSTSIAWDVSVASEAVVVMVVVGCKVEIAIDRRSGVGTPGKNEDGPLSL